MLLSDIWAECGRLLNDPFNTRWTTDVLTTRANLATTEIQGYTNAVKTIEQITPTANTEVVSLSNYVLDILIVSKTLTDGSVVPLNGITRQELDFLYPDWQQWQAGEPLFFWYEGSLQHMHLVPKPDAANAITNGLTLYESQIPTAMVSGTDQPWGSNNSEMVPFHIAVVHWVVAYCWMDNGDPESLAKSKFHKSGSMHSPGEYEKQLGRIMSEFDVTELVPSRILFRPQGGRLGSWLVPSKSYPLSF